AGSELSFSSRGAAWLSAISFNCDAEADWAASEVTALTDACATGAGFRAAADRNPRIPHPPAVPASRHANPSRAVRSLVHRMAKCRFVPFICPSLLWLLVYRREC